MALNKTIKINSVVNKSINNYNNKETKTIYDKIILKGTNNNKSCILQNLYLANLLNMEKMNLNTNNNNINSIIKNVNINKCFLENCKNSGLNEDKKYINNNNKEKFYNSIDSAKRKKKIFSLMRIKSNMKYIKENPFFNDLNLQPSSEKSWLFSCEKKNQINNRNIKNYENINKKKRIIPKINIKKNINNSNLIYKSNNFNTFLLKDIKKRGSNSQNKKIISNYSNKSSHKTDIKKNDNIILGYKHKNSKSYKEQSKNIIKNNNKTKISYEIGYNKRILKSKNCYKNNIFKLNYFKASKSNPIILIDNNGLNSLKNKDKKESDNAIDTNNLNEDLIMSNISFSDESKVNESDNILNPIYS